MLARFLRLHPAKFSRATEPLEAMAWLRSVNKDLVTTSCTDAEKVRFAAHLLEGPAASWWDTYQITHPIDGVTWDSFQEGFRAAHISAGVMSLKKKELRDLKQRYHSVSEYIDEFTNLSCYTPDDIDTDAKRKEKFLEGLNDELSIPLSVAYTPTFHALLDQAIILENKMKQSKSRKRKHHSSKYHEHVQKCNLHDDNGGSGSHKHGNVSHHYGHNHHYHGRYEKNQHEGNGHDHNGHKNHNKNYGSGNDNRCGHTNGGNNGMNGRTSKFNKRDISRVQCYNCKELGHYSWDCTEKKKDVGRHNRSDKRDKNQLECFKCHEL
jgi:hypothetical protein